MNAPTDDYPARLAIEYPERLDRLSTLLRLIFIIPIGVVVYLLSNASAPPTLPTVLMLLFRRKYPRWWFDYMLEYQRFMARISAYASLMTDQYPSTDEEQSVRLDIDYPDASQLSRWLPLIKWLLALPHLIVLAVLGILASLAEIAAWFVIVFTGRYPRPLFSFVLNVARYGQRLNAYAIYLVTDRYPPFRLG